MTFAHAVHETTVLGPLTASLAAMGVLHDKGQLSDDELAFAKSIAFARYDRDDKGQVLLPGDSSNPSAKPDLRPHPPALWPHCETAAFASSSRTALRRATWVTSWR